MNKSEIMDTLPHRGNMLLLDGVRLEGDTAKGYYTVRGDEWFLDGHFPGNPVVPGVILCEILGQSACIFFEKKTEGKTPLFTGMSNVKFKSMVRPGDVFDTECVLKKMRHPFYYAAGQGSVGGKVCVKAEFSFAMIDTALESEKE